MIKTLRLCTNVKEIPHLICLLSLISLSTFVTPAVIAQQSASNNTLTPLQYNIQKQQQRLSSSDAEERRDAVMKLGTLHHRDASRVASTVLNDPVVSVRVAAAHAILSLPSEESASALIPLLKDKDEFVRQETAYTLGRTHSRTAVAPLIDLLATEKKTGVRGAAVVALGQLGDQSAVVPLSVLLSPDTSTNSKKKKTVSKENEFVLRASAHSLGEIGSRAALPSLLAVLNNEKSPPDLRREAAVALGMIGDPDARPSLQSLSSSGDPHLAQAAVESLRMISRRQQSGH